MALLLDQFTRIVDRLNSEGIDYAVCGGLAMAVHGYPRATVDIDILILSDDLERIWSLAKGEGFTIEGLPLSLHGGDVEIRRISKIDAESKELITLDLLLVTDALQDVWKGREIYTLGGREVRAVGKTGLIKLKTMSGRTIDLADIENLRK